MANYDQRQPLDYRFGQLAGGVTALDTALSSSAFAGLPSTLSPTLYVPMTLADDSLGLYETVWVTGHSASSTTITVVRGREGTTARTWAAGSTWRIAPTARDVLSAYTRAGLPADAHMGMRAVLTDENVPVVKTPVGWAVPLGGGQAGRKHSWTKGAITVPHNADLIVTGMTPGAGNGSIATYDGTVVKLNRPGIWTLGIYAYTDVATEGQVVSWLNWPNGSPGSTMFDRRDRRLSGNSGQLDTSMSWTGYVDAAAAAAGMNPAFFAWQTNLGTAYGAMSLYAEYLGG